MGRLSEYEWQLAIGLTFLGTYLLLLMWARRAYIARSNERWTQAQRRAFLAALPPSAGDVPRERAAAFALARLQELWRDDAEAQPIRPSDHIADWVVLHEAKRQAAWLLLPDDQVWPRFDRTMGQLDELSPRRQAEWRERHRELICPTPRRPAEVRSTLVELLSEVYNARDAKYAQLASLYNKAFWLTAIALLPLAVLVVLGEGVVLVAGAIGGLISRLQRIVYAEGLPTAYGSSWVPLFGAPLLGALAAWGGLHILTVLQALGVVDLKSLIPRPEVVDALRPTAPLVGVAVLLGLSERILNRFGEQAEKILGPETTGTNGDVQVAPPPVRGQQTAHEPSRNGAAVPA